MIRSHSARVDNPLPALLGGSLLVLSFLGACTGTIAPTPFPTPATYPTPVATTEVAAELDPPPTAMPTVSPTPDPYRGLTIPDLRSRSYGTGTIQFEPEQRVSSRFSRYFFDYPSDGISVHGFLDLPHGEGPFPVVLVLHGYIDPALYQTLTYTTRYADSLAGEGFLVLHPNFRNYPPSDPGPNPFRVGYAVDVLNLIALIEKQAGQPGPLENADPKSVGLFGHSMGGGIALRVITAQAPVQAAVVYASMSADDQLNFEKIYEWSDGQRGAAEFNTPVEDLARISPINYLDGIEAAVSIHHGAADRLVPPEWSEDLCRRLTELEKIVECFSYPGEPHTFIGYGSLQLMDRSVTFFQEHLGSP